MSGISKYQRRRRRCWGVLWGHPSVMDHLGFIVRSGLRCASVESKVAEIYVGPHSEELKLFGGARELLGAEKIKCYERIDAIIMY